MFNQEAAGKRLRDRRLELNLSIDECAEMLDVSPGFYGLIERGKRFTGPNNLMKLSGMLGLSLDYMITGEGSVEEVGSYKARLKDMIDATITEEEAKFLIDIHMLVSKHHCPQKDLVAIHAVAASFLDYVKETN